MKKLMRLGLLIFFMGVTFGPNEAHAQFRNNGIYLPSLGWMGLEPAPMLSIRPTIKNGRLLTIGRWVLVILPRLVISFGGTIRPTLVLGNPLLLGVDKTLVSLSVSSGLRYNFLRHKHRPFVSGNFHYLQFMNIEGTAIKGNPNLNNTAMWIGLRPGGGYEYFVAPEMSLMGELNYILFVSLDHPVRHSLASRLSFNVYF